MNAFENLIVGGTYTADETVYTERELILGILWEGDLEIHSNAELMKTNAFGRPIAHGDGGAAKSAAQLLKMDLFQDKDAIRFKKIGAAYVSPTYVGDRITFKFTVARKDNLHDGSTEVELLTETTKNNGEAVAKGSMILGCCCPDQPPVLVGSIPEFMPVTDLHEGNTGRTAGKTLSESDLDLFYRSLYGNGALPENRTKAPEILVTMLSIGAMNRLGFLERDLVAVAENTWEYSRDLLVGDTLNVHYAVDAVKVTKSGGRVVTFALKAVNQRLEIIAQGVWKTFMKG